MLEFQIPKNAKSSLNLVQGQIVRRHVAWDILRQLPLFRVCTALGDQGCTGPSGCERHFFCLPKYQHPQ